MTGALTPAMRERLIGCLRLWSRPGTPGERDAAAAAAARLLRAAELDWSDIIPAVPPVDRGPAGWRALVERCLNHPDALHRWEVGFLRNLRTFQRISDRQRAVLDGIGERLGVLEEEAA